MVEATRDRRRNGYSILWVPSTGKYAGERLSKRGSRWPDPDDAGRELDGLRAGPFGLLGAAAATFAGLVHGPVAAAA